MMTLHCRDANTSLQAAIQPTDEAAVHRAVQNTDKDADHHAVQNAEKDTDNNAVQGGAIIVNPVL